MPRPLCRRRRFLRRSARALSATRTSSTTPSISEGSSASSFPPRGVTAQTRSASPNQRVASRGECRFGRVTHAFFSCATRRCSSNTLLSHHQALFRRAKSRSFPGKEKAGFHASDRFHRPPRLSWRRSGQVRSGQVMSGARTPSLRAQERQSRDKSLSRAHTRKSQRRVRGHSSGRARGSGRATRFCLRYYSFSFSSFSRARVRHGGVFPACCSAASYVSGSSSSLWATTRGRVTCARVSDGPGWDARLKDIKAPLSPSSFFILFLHPLSPGVRHHRPHVPHPHACTPKPRERARSSPSTRPPHKTLIVSFALEVFVFAAHIVTRRPTFVVVVVVAASVLFPFTCFAAVFVASKFPGFHSSLFSLDIGLAIFINKHHRRALVHA